MISFILVVVALMAKNTLAINFLFPIFMVTAIVQSYSKWSSHFSMVLINLEFFTLIILFMGFMTLSKMNLGMSLMMLMMTSVVVEACLGLSLLIMMVRTQSKESLISGLN